MMGVWVVSDLVCLFALLGLDLSQVEFQLFAFQNIAISSAALPRSRGNASWEIKGEKNTIKNLNYEIKPLPISLKLIQPSINGNKTKPSLQCS